jgi:hypothetical protein
MHLIYGQSHCISWMGVESDDEFDLQSVLPTIRCLSELEEQMNAHQVSLTWNNVDEHIQEQPVQGASGLHQIPWTRLMCCLDRDIFERLWCVQEILLARSNDVRAFKSHIDIAVLARSTWLIKSVLKALECTTASESEMHRRAGAPFSDLRTLHGISKRISSMLMTAPLPCLEFKKAGRPIATVTALSIVYRNSGRECSDPRDHVYGLAALCNLGTSYNISYSTLSLTTQEVFADFTLHSLRTTRSLEAFQLMCRRAIVRSNYRTDIAQSLRPRSWTPGLSTWVPDFAGPVPAMRRISSEDRRREILLSASKSRPVELTRSSRQKLGVIGVEIGTVQVCGTERRGSSDSDTDAHFSSYLWQYFASIQRCMDTIQSSMPAQFVCRQLLDVLSMGLRWQHCPVWADLACRLPAQTSDRMIDSSLGAAWIIYHLPGLASKAKLSLHRWLNPRGWRAIANHADLWLYSANQGTRLSTTDNVDALTGTGPEGLRVGDIICVLYGGDVPFILHPDGKGQYVLIGECYVSGIMQGEALDMRLEECEFVLV